MKCLFAYGNKEALKSSQLIKRNNKEEKWFFAFQFSITEHQKLVFNSSRRGESEKSQGAICSRAMGEIGPEVIQSLLLHLELINNLTN